MLKLAELRVVEQLRKALLLSQIFEPLLVLTGDTGAEVPISFTKLPDLLTARSVANRLI